VVRSTKPRHTARSHRRDRESAYHELKARTEILMGKDPSVRPTSSQAFQTSQVIPI
jgi:hypothetical protein